MNDLETIFQRLSESRFRSKFQLGAKDRLYLEQRGAEAIEQHAREFIANRVAAAQPRNDGKQTPWRGHPVFVAQHATATCCRSCIAKWHGIPSGRPLGDEEQEHLVRAIMRWLDDAGR